MKMNSILELLRGRNVYNNTPKITSEHLQGNSSLMYAMTNFHFSLSLVYFFLQVPILSSPRTLPCPPYKGGWNIGRGRKSSEGTALMPILLWQLSVFLFIICSRGQRVHEVVLMLCAQIDRHVWTLTETHSNVFHLMWFD